MLYIRQQTIRRICFLPICTLCRASLGRLMHQFRYGHHHDWYRQSRMACPVFRTIPFGLHVPVWEKPLFLLGGASATSPLRRQNPSNQSFGGLLFNMEIPASVLHSVMDASGSWMHSSIRLSRVPEQNRMTSDELYYDQACLGGYCVSILPDTGTRTRPISNRQPSTELCRTLNAKSTIVITSCVYCVVYSTQCCCCC